MSEEYQILWIDDNRDRDDDEVDSLRGESDKILVEFHPPDELFEKLDPENEDTSIPESDLILIDWFLHQQSDYPGTGVSFEGRIRNEFPEVPVYGFSGQEHDERYDEKLGGERFDKMFTLSDLTQPNIAENLIQDIEDYQALQSIRGEGIEALIGVFNPPESVDPEELESAFPQEFSNGIPDEKEYDSGDALRFARWVMEEFIEIPGIVWDKKVTATKLGLKEEVFDQFSDQFTPARYSGIFTPWDEKRWWKSEIIQLLLDIDGNSASDLTSPRRAGPEIIGVDDEDIATCSVCGEKYPETVAYRSIDSGRRLPVHYRCSKIETARDGVFDDLRIIERSD